MIRTFKRIKYDDIPKKVRDIIIEWNDDVIKFEDGNLKEIEINKLIKLIKKDVWTEE